MTTQQTLAILKPDVVQDNRIGAVLTRIEESGLQIIASKMIHLSQEQAKAFYAVHAHRPFFPELVQFMTEGPVLVCALEGEDAVGKYRTLMGATNPAQADRGTIRADFATSIDRNAVHGSDSLENAKVEVAFFFSPAEIFSARGAVKR